MVCSRARAALEFSDPYAVFVYVHGQHWIFPNSMQLVCKCTSEALKFLNTPTNQRKVTTPQRGSGRVRTFFDM